MGMVAEWGRGIARAGSVALLLPLALALAFLLTAAVGGGDRLRALGQVVGGPSAPAATTRGAPDLAAAERVPALRIGRTSPALVRALSSPPTRRATPHQRSPASRRPGSPPSRTQPTAPTPSAPQPAPQPSGGGGSPSPQPSPANPVQQVGQQVADTAKQLPAPVGPVAGDTVQTVVDLITPPQAQKGLDRASQPHPPPWAPSHTPSPPQSRGGSPISSRG